MPVLRPFVEDLLTAARLMAGVASGSISADLPADLEDARTALGPVGRERELYDALISAPALRDATEALFRDGHYAEAVEAGFKALNSFVRKRSGLTLDGVTLFEQAFSEQKPRLRLNRLRSRSDLDEQIGFQRIMAGCITGIRNPRAHDHRRTDAPEEALEMLVMANHLFRRAAGATRTRAKR